MPGDYDILSTVYTELNMGQFAATMAPRLLDYAQRNDWMGRQVLDLGCGTGTGSEWLAKHGYIMTGVDQSPDMLQIARDYYAGSNLNFRWLEQDVRHLTNISGMDLVLSFDVMHEFNNLRDIETAFKSVHETLKPNKLFIFDLYTIEGLIERNQSGDELNHDDNNMTIFLENQFDYERQVQTRRFIIFRKQDKAWMRHDAKRILRAYPIQAIVALLKRCGFDTMNVLKTDLSIYEPGKSSATRVIIIAQKR